MFAPLTGVERYQVTEPRLAGWTLRLERRGDVGRLRGVYRSACGGTVNVSIDCIATARGDESLALRAPAGGARVSFSSWNLLARQDGIRAAEDLFDALRDGKFQVRELSDWNCARRPDSGRWRRR